MAGVLAVLGLGLALGHGTDLWNSAHPGSPPYAPRAAPVVDVDVVAEASAYGEVDDVTREVEPLVKAYVQRLRTGDARELAALGAPWFEGRPAAAREAITAHQGRGAGDAPASVLVRDVVVPDQATAELRFGSGPVELLGLTRADGVWWVELGDGDPVAP
ncbi:hypothetical protein ACIO1C_18745 [Streptomyces sp. NPDC087420]|uniref:hypothetical protein n=1 Tax=Streptomyces sp. NPDC087420 TaxID=3365785 RepID=UPI00383557B3